MIFSLGRAVSCGRGADGFRHDGAWNFPCHHRRVDAAIRAFADDGAFAAAGAVRRDDAAGIHARAAPNTHFIILSQGILFRGAGLDVVWPQFAALAAIGVALFWVALIRFKKFLR